MVCSAQSRTRIRVDLLMMATSSSYSTRSSSVKRLLQEAKELRALQDEGLHAEPLQDNLHEFHFTIRGPSDSEFEGGLYHGRILVSHLLFQMLLLWVSCSSCRAVTWREADRSRFLLLQLPAAYPFKAPGRLYHHIASYVVSDIELLC